MSTHQRRHGELHKAPSSCSILMNTLHNQPLVYVFCRTTGRRMYSVMCSTVPLKTLLGYWIMWLCRASNVQCAFMSVLPFHQFVKRKRLKTTLHSLYVLCQFELYIRGLVQRNSTRRLKAKSGRFLCSAATLTATRLPPIQPSAVPAARQRRSKIARDWDGRMQVALWRSPKVESRSCDLRKTLTWRMMYTV